ncbi:MAG TPA: (4Fe-4S)-binding protein [Candidatus Binataceae bacterium]|nr:(4Fe-4S)-binding protein [Candidatus Binataceae bacterium]
MPQYVPEEVLDMALEVTYDRRVCIHSGNCVKTLPQVFKVVNKQFVIEPTAADESKVRATVAACPSGALKLKE